MHPSASKEHTVRHQSAASSGSAITDVIGALVRVLMSLPNGMRALVLIVILTIGGFIGYAQFVKGVSPDGKDPLRAAAEYINGVADPDHSGADTLNPQNLEAAHKADEDGLAVTWHFNHETDDHPAETAIDVERQVYYRYFANTDRCVFIRRREGDRDLTQWVRDPSFHTHDVDGAGQQASSARKPAQDNKRASVGMSLAQSLGGLLAVASAETRPPGEINATEAQANSCLNPHPGQFRYWWGPPNDQCNSPMFRQFADGCTHYQLYNRCANAWDSRIFWTACVVQHSS